MRDGIREFFRFLNLLLFFCSVETFSLVYLLCRYDTYSAMLKNTGFNVFSSLTFLFMFLYFSNIKLKPFLVKIFLILSVLAIPYFYFFNYGNGIQFIISWVSLFWIIFLIAKKRFSFNYEKSFYLSFFSTALAGFIWEIPYDGSQQLGFLINQPLAKFLNFPLPDILVIFPLVLILKELSWKWKNRMSEAIFAYVLFSIFLFFIHFKNIEWFDRLPIILSFSFILFRGLEIKNVCKKI